MNADLTAPVTEFEGYNCQHHIVAKIENAIFGECDHGVL